MRKIFLLLTISLAFSLLTGTVFAQNSNKQSFVTTDMAMKISNYFQYNTDYIYIFLGANFIEYNRESDRIIRTLDTHLDYAERFLLSLYNHYGLENGYFALKKIGFTIQETDIVESVWKNQPNKLKQQAEAEKKYNDKKLSEWKDGVIMPELREEEEEYSCDGKIQVVPATYGIENKKEVNQQSIDNYIEMRVDLNDYFGYYGTDWNYTEIDDEESQKFFYSVLKKNGIYYSEKQHCYVKKLKNTEEELLLEKQRQEEQRKQIELLRRQNKEKFEQQEEQQFEQRRQSEEQYQQQTFRSNVVSGSNGINFNLAGRSLCSTPPTPEYNSESEGKVVVEIRVDRKGNVVSASPGKAGTSTNDPILREAAKNAALKTKFNSDPNAAEIQVGTITYTFINL